MPSKVDVRTTTTRLEVIEKLGIAASALKRAKPKSLTNPQRARLLGVPVDKLVLPGLLTPAAPITPITAKSSLLLFSCMMMDPTFPAGSGQALFSSQYQGATSPGAQVAFPRVKTGAMHLVEFHVTLFGTMTYTFRVFRYPLGKFEDVSIPGGQSQVIAALVEPLDEIAGDLQLGAAIQQRNQASEAAGWTLHSVTLSTTA
jgi:hypothetical protein